MLMGKGDHGIGHVDAEYRSAGACPAGRDKAFQARARTQVHNRVAGADVCVQDRAAAPVGPDPGVLRDVVHD